MNNSDYWIKRQEAKYLDAERELGKFYTELIKSFQKSKKDIHSVVNDFYIRYANNNELNYDVAMMELNFNELKNLKDELSIFKKMSIESIGEFNLELENMSMKARITRYQALETQIDAILTNLYSIDYKAYGSDKFIDIYKDQYYKTIFNIEQYRGFHQEFAQVNVRAVEELINYPFSGVAYSDRLWKQKDHMLEKLKESIMNMIIKGTNPAELSDEFAAIFERKQFEAYRLLQMEGAFIIEQATIKGYEEDDVEEYEILATLDLKTSEICRKQDGKVYKTKEAVTGVNLPPFHWYCRTTTTPHFEDDEVGKRIARDPISSKNYKVSADMKYNDWYNEYAANNPKAIIEEKKLKNRYSDNKQYNKYKEILGNDAPKSFAEFQELKYTDNDGWKLTKYNYKLKNEVKNNPKCLLENADRFSVDERKYTSYLFAGTNEIGLAKGNALNSRLGYNIDNYKEFDKLIKNNISKYPSILKGDTPHGTRYEVNMVVNGLKKKQAKLRIGVMYKSDNPDIPQLTTVFIDKLKESDFKL